MSAEAADRHLVWANQLMAQATSESDPHSSMVDLVRLPKLIAAALAEAESQALRRRLPKRKPKGGNKAPLYYNGACDGWNACLDAIEKGDGG